MTIFAPVLSECEPEGDGQFEVVEEYGPIWMTEHSIILTDEYNCPGMEAGWMLCTLCGRQLAGHWNVFTHLSGKQHKNQMGWKTAQAALKARAAVTSNTGTSWVPPALPESTASSYPPPPALPTVPYTSAAPQSTPSNSADWTRWTAQTAAPTTSASTWTPPLPIAHQCDLPNFPAAPVPSHWSLPKQEGKKPTKRRSQQRVPVPVAETPTWMPPPPSHMPSVELPTWQPQAPPPPPKNPPKNADEKKNAEQAEKKKEHQFSAENPWTFSVNACIGLIGPAASTDIRERKQQQQQRHQQQEAVHIDEDSDDEPPPPTYDPTPDCLQAPRVRPTGQDDLSNFQAPSGPKTKTRNVILNYDASEVDEAGNPEGGYLRVRIGQRITIEHEALPGHARNLYDQYIFARLDDHEQGWLPTACLQ